MTTEDEMRTTMQDEAVWTKPQQRRIWRMVRGWGKTDRLPALVSVAHIPARTCTWLADLVEAQP
jgi:hypothetical protein